MHNHDPGASVSRPEPALIRIQLARRHTLCGLLSARKHAALAASRPWQSDDLMVRPYCPRNLSLDPAQRVGGGEWKRRAAGRR